MARAIETVREINVNMTLRGPLASALQAAADRRGIEPAELFADVVEALLGSDFEEFIEIVIDMPKQDAAPPPPEAGRGEG